MVYYILVAYTSTVAAKVKQHLCIRTDISARCNSEEHVEINRRNGKYTNCISHYYLYFIIIIILYLFSIIKETKYLFLYNYLNGIYKMDGFSNFHSNVKYFLLYLSLLSASILSLIFVCANVC